VLNWAHIQFQCLYSYCIILNLAFSLNYIIVSNFIVFRGFEVQPTIFPYDTLKAATNNFQEILGEGHFGIVYKVFLTPHLHLTRL
jgi:hypothetical protein